MTARLFQRAVVVGAAGGVGRLLSEQLRGSAERLDLIDLSAGPGIVQANVLRPDPAFRETIARASLVVLALPHAVLEAAIPTVSALLAATAPLVETGSTKAALGRAVAADAGLASILGINPMFGPSIGFAGEAVLLVRHRPATGHGDAFVECLEAWGARVMSVSAEEHDSLVATLQAACHSAVLGFGEALRRHGVTPQLLAAATPPARVMLLLLSRILTGPPQTYWEVQAGNDQAAGARAAVRAGIGCLEHMADVSDAASFEHWLEDLRAPLRGDLALLATRAAAMLSAVGPLHP